MVLNSDVFFLFRFSSWLSYNLVYNIGTLNMHVQCLQFSVQEENVLQTEKNEGKRNQNENIEHWREKKKLCENGLKLQSQCFRAQEK